MPIISVSLLAGRTTEQKAAFVKGVAEVSMRTLNVPESAISVVLLEVQPENWGVGSRTMAEVRATASRQE